MFAKISLIIYISEFSLSLDTMSQKGEEETVDLKARAKRKYAGRSARRRRKKLLDILRAEEEIRNGTEAPPKSIVPHDRSEIWAGVLECRNRYQWNESDKAALISQLGYLPGNLVRVVTRSEDVSQIIKQNNDANLPVVVQLYPIAIREESEGGKNGKRYKSRKRQRIDDTSNEESTLIEPFPTMLWLTNPLLRIIISRLEVNGYGTELEKRLAENPDHFSSMKCAHDAYGRARYQMLTPSDASLLQAKNWISAVDCSRGVAGIRHARAVKCLHAHAAHYLSGMEGWDSNVVGKWAIQAVSELLGSTSEDSTRPPGNRVE